MNNSFFNNVYLGLGSNKGDKTDFIKKTIESIKKIKSCELISVSSLYESLPFGDVEQENFLNAVIKIKTFLDHNSLLKILKDIEKEIGRIQSKRWGPREIDIDILFFNDLIFSNEIITLPHKGVIYRDFVLVPLGEIEPDLVHPVYKKKVCDFIKELKTHNIIKKIPFSILT